MTAEMRILGWSSEGLRCPDHSVDCCIDDKVPYKISLIQMPNGTGKTTTLNLLRAALSGAAETWDRSKIREFKKKNADLDQGQFMVWLLLNEKPVTIIMDFDFSSGSVLYKTTRSNGQENKFNPPFDFRRFMKEDFVNFFVFDGELAKGLLDKRKTDADKVVEGLFQVDTFKTISSRVSDYWDSKTSDASAKEEKGWKRRKNKLDRLNTRLAELTKEKEGLEANRDKLTNKLNKQKAKYKDKIKEQEELSDKIDAAEEELKSLRGKTKEVALQALESMADPHAICTQFASDMYTFKQSLDRVKLPESAAREFFEELAEESECICGRPIDDTIRAVIRDRAGNYLGSEDVALLNTIKTAVEESLGQSLELPEQELVAKLDDLKKNDSDAQLAQNVLDQLQNEAESADPDAKAAKEKIDELESALGIILKDLEKFDSTDKDAGDKRTFGLEVLRKRRDKAEKDLAEITETLTLKKKRDVLLAIVSSAFTKAKEGIASEICSDANSKISLLMPNNDIKIHSLNKSLNLDGQSGGSVGEELSIAYGFLSTLFDRTEHSLPFVVDSPAGPIDLHIRPKIGELVPKLGGQFIAFTISSEREGFVGKLQEASPEPVQLLTIFRKGATQLEDNARAADDSVETEDGFMVVGEEFFNDFQLDSEES